jgi:secondary thiamine-phosphate synthase enzyme
VKGIYRDTLEIETRGKGFVDITRRVAEIVTRSGIREGLCSAFISHTSASLVIQENADPSVLRDLERFFDRTVPGSYPYEHDAEGPDDMPAHIKSAMLHTSETIPVQDGLLLLGTWQALYLVEHRARPHTRRVVVTVLGPSL